jgi:hypothetical protein
MTTSETDMDDRRAAWPVRGLARRFPADDLESLQTLLKEYAYRLPDELPHGVEFVQAGGPGDDFYMATNGKGGFWVREIEHGSFTVAIATPEPSTGCGGWQVRAVLVRAIWRGRWQRSIARRIYWKAHAMSQRFLRDTAAILRSRFKPPWI